MITDSTLPPADDTSDIQLPTAAILIFSMTAYIFLILVLYLIRRYLKSKEMCVNVCNNGFSCDCKSCYELLQLCDCGNPSCDSCFCSFCPKTKLSIVDVCLCHCFDAEGCCKMGECNCERGCGNIRCGSIEISIRNTAAAR